VPVRHRGEVVAVLNVESLRPAAFRGQLPLLEAVADQIGGAVAGSLAFQQARQRAHSLQVLTDVSRLVVTPGDLDTRLARLTDYLQKQFDLTLAAVLVSDESGQEWEHRAISTRPPATVVPNERWPVTEGVVGRAIRTGVPQLVHDVRADPDYIPLRDDVVAELAVPLTFGHRTLGAFNLEVSDPDLLSPDHVQLFRAVADQVAGAIELAVLNRRLDESRQAIEASHLELGAVNQALQRMTLVDGLTGVANRRHLEARLEEEWRRALRAGDPLSFALVDIDCFKAFNDTYGHPGGDDCLRRVAGTLAQQIERAGELLARYGGEEFAAVLPRLDAEQAWRALDGARANVAALRIPHRASTAARHVTVSAGVATLVPTADRSPQDLVARADEALYRAKSGGRNRTERG
jgi:diguanylate cyclase (GGDEF)-like protein